MKNAAVSQKNMLLGESLLEAGKVTQEQLNEALQYKQRFGGKLGQALVALEFATEEDLIDALRKQGKVQCINLSNSMVNTALALEFGEKRSRQFRSVVVNRIAGYTTVAMEDPSDVYAIDEMSMVLGSRILPVYAEPSKIDAAIDYVFSNEMAASHGPRRHSIDRFAVAMRDDGDGTPRSIPMPIREDSGSQIKLDTPQGPDPQEREPDLDQPVINLVRSVLQEAFLQGASDIHLEPRANDFLVRFRVDGGLYDRVTVPREWSRQILARIKVLAGLDIAQRRLPQDGRTQFSYNGKRIDLRIATTPSLHGEGAVLRILDGGRELQSLAGLDLSPDQLKTLQRITSCRDGFFLATGPTGSGKTTTLYAILQELNSRDKKIITLEDPVENELDDVTQINANPKIGLTFAKGLRSILRQDPDIVLVGEVRDQETAEIAVQASLTGHMVLSTLHTVGAIESITRLQDMGIEPFLLADTLRGIVAQRLLRRICNDCKREKPADPETLKRLGLEGGTFYEGVGCESCHETGLKGRIGIYEILQLTPELCSMVQRNVPTDELHRAAIAAGLVTLREDGLRKAKAGLTTLNEVLSATTRG